MSERPILFSGPMVRAILEGRKTQTRRLVKTQPSGLCHVVQDPIDGQWYEDGGTWIARAPYAPGDTLWVRETWAPRLGEDGPDENQRYVKYRADRDRKSPSEPMDWHTWDSRWTSAIHMPRWASRLMLRVTDVRVQRVQEIHHNLADLEAEGVELPPSTLFPHTNRADKLERVFAELWDSINGKRAPWASNPWVFAITFERALKGGERG